MAEATLEPLKGPLRIIDPAMGCGAFLLAAVRRVHPYEEPVVNIISIGADGLGGARQMRQIEFRESLRA